MDNSANLDNDSWIQLEIPGLFEQLENSLNSLSGDEMKRNIDPANRIRGYKNKVRLRGLKTQ